MPEFSNMTNQSVTQTSAPARTACAPKVRARYGHRLKIVHNCHLAPLHVLFACMNASFN